MMELSWGVMSRFSVLIWVGVTWANTYAEIYQDEQLRYIPHHYRNFTFMHYVVTLFKGDSFSAEI